MHLLRTSAYWWHFITSRVISSPLYAFSVLRKLILRRSLLWSRFTTKAVPPKCQRKVLQELPVELLTEVMKYLEWYDVLHLRQTCKRFHAASRERAIWKTLLQHYIKTIKPRPYWPDRPLDFYNTDELEALVLRRHKVASCWSKPETAPSLHRTFLAANRSIRCSHLVRGGRWFLVGSQSGEILYFDLDAPSITPRALIPSQYTSSDELFPHMSVDVDNDAPHLSFTVALQVQCYDDGAQPLNGLIQIWRVTVHVDDKGRGSALISTNVASFMEEIGTDISRVSIHGSYVTYSFDNWDTNRSFTCIVNWQTMDNTSLFYNRLVIPSHFSWVAFLPNNWILCNREVYLHLYNLSDLPETTLPLSQRNLPDVSPRCKFTTSSGNFSEAYTIGEAERFIFSTAEQLRGIQLPHDNPVGAEIVDLCSDVYLEGCQLGYNYAPGFSGTSDFSVLQYAWPDARKESRVIPKKYERDNRPTKFHLDEASGRLVITGGSEWEYDIVEFIS